QGRRGRPRARPPRDVRPEPAGIDPAPRGLDAARSGASTVAHGRASSARRHVARPAVVPAAGARIRGLPHPGRPVVPLRGRHPSRRRRHRRERAELRTRGAARREREGLMLDRFDELADGLTHPEGVAWNPFDGLIYAGGEGGELYSVTLDGDVELRGSTGGSMLGIAVDGAGRVYACDAGRGEITRMDPLTGVRNGDARGADT